MRVFIIKVKAELQLPPSFFPHVCFFNMQLPPFSPTCVFLNATAAFFPPRWNCVFLKCDCCLFSTVELCFNLKVGRGEQTNFGSQRPIGELEGISQENFLEMSNTVQCPVSAALSSVQCPVSSVQFPLSSWETFSLFLCF